MNEEFKRFKAGVKDLAKRIYKWFKLPVFRVHVLKIVAVGLSFVLVASVYMIHIVYADQFHDFREIATTATLSREVPRGVIYDRNMVALVTNSTVNVITYRHVPNTYVGHMKEVALRLAALIDFDYETVLTHRDKQELFIELNLEYARNLVPQSMSQGISNDEFHLLMLNEITAEHLEELTAKQLRTQAIFIRMHQGAGMTTNIIMENPSEAEIAKVIENLVNLPGIEVGVDWVREYPSAMHNHLFGTVSTHQQGIPRDREAYFLSQGYAANARVGMSHLERSMQSYLSGFQYQYFLADGVPTQTAAGLPGFSVSLTIDNELQLILEELVAEHLITERLTVATAQHLHSAYVVLQNPNTGEVLALVGIRLEQNADGTFETIYDPFGTFLRAYAVGSSIKGASLMAGYHFGVTSVGQTRFDTPIHIQSSIPLSSHMNMGTVSDITAISRSSNVFFFLQTMELAGIHNHVQGAPIFNWMPEAWDFYRDYFGQLGLGTRTGIQLQDESIGMRVPVRDFSNLVHFAIGQSDTYTTMQLAQFASVMATRGYRFQTQIIRDIYMPGYDLTDRQLVRDFTPNLLNYVELTEAQWHNLHEGHRQVTHTTQGTGFNSFNASFANIAGKTGTAQAPAYNLDNTLRLGANGMSIEIHNRTFLGWAPYDNPQVAVAVIVPQSETAGMPGSSLVNDIARDAVEAYFELQSQRTSRR